MGADSRDTHGDQEYAGPEGGEGKQAGADGVRIRVGPRADLCQEEDAQQRSIAQDQKAESGGECPVGEIFFHVSFCEGKGRITLV